MHNARVKGADVVDDMEEKAETEARRRKRDNDLSRRAQRAGVALIRGMGEVGLSTDGWLRAR